MEKKQLIQKAKPRVKRIFRFLQELHRIKTPPVVRLDQREFLLTLDALPYHNCITRGSIDQGPHEYLKVQRPEETQCPEPSVVIRNWLRLGWNQADIENDQLVKPSQKGPNGETEYFKDSEDRTEAFETWVVQRGEWAQREKTVRQVAKAFSKLFELYGKFQRESEKYQLFLADGILVNPTPQGSVHHPILLQRVQLRFNASIPEFSLQPTEDTPEIYVPLLRYAGVEGKNIQHAIDEVQEKHFHPLGEAPTSEFFKDLIQRFWKNGQFFENPLEVPATITDPYIVRQPHFFLGNRNQGLEENLRAYLQSIDKLESLPESLLRIVGIEPPVKENQPCELLLTNHSNPEQERVIQQLEENGAVLVQGPPGTGKSHTIGNLIGHLLAHQKSILVTSHSSKALKVVREKVAKPLQSLCVSVLQTDEEGNKELEESISGIVNYLATTNENKLKKEIEKLEAKRKELKDTHEALSKNLFQSLAEEYQPQHFYGQSWTPSEAAQQLAKSENSWIPEPIGDQFPLSQEEVEQIYASHGKFSLAEATTLASNLPDPKALPTPQVFGSFFDEMRSFEKENKPTGAEFWVHNNQSSESLTKVAQTIQHTVNQIPETSPWVLECLDAHKLGTTSSWMELTQMIDEAVQQIPNWEALVLQVGPKIRSNKAPSEQLRIAKAILQKLKSGKKVTKLSALLKPEWKEFIQTVQVDGLEPKTVKHFEAVIAAIEIRLTRDHLQQRWERQITELGAPSWSELGRKPERKAKDYSDTIHAALIWFSQTWQNCHKEICDVGLHWNALYQRFCPKEPKLHEFEKIRSILQKEVPLLLSGRKAFLQFQSLEKKKDAWLQYLEDFPRKDSDQALIKSFKKALKKQDYDLYSHTFKELERFRSLQGDFNKYVQLLEKLNPFAPNWVKAIKQRKAPHDTPSIPGDLQTALCLLQWKKKLEKLSENKLEKIETDLESIKNQLHETTAQYVEKLAWLAQRQRTGLQEQQALNGWLGLHKKIGKGTGKHVGRLKEEAKKTLKTCKSAVPVWIMPLSRVAESFELATTRFDVVIIDEASQSDVMGLIAFALGKEVVVVGDHEQVSPYAVGQNTEKIHTLIDEILTDIPNAQLYDGKTSVYDLARQCFGGTIRLLEHFRCVPDIIQFSNSLCYGGEVRALREASSTHLLPSVVDHKVKNGKETNGVNRNEALEIVSLVTAICRLEEYENSTIGVICLLGTDQALYIDSILRKRLSATEYKKRRILCGNASQFQGDERDIVFLSLVNSPSDRPLHLRQREDAKKVFNVAASRARNQLWVVHSLNPGRDLKPGDLRLQLISHAKNPALSRPKRENKKTISQSDFEVHLQQKLMETHYQISAGYQIGNIQVGLVVHGDRGQKIILQCEGDRPLPEQKLSENIAHQSTLTRLGWRFIRLRASDYYQHPDELWKNLTRKMKALGIHPQKNTNQDTQELTTEDIKTRVLKRAELIRNRWKDIPTLRAVKKEHKQSGDSKKVS